MTSNSKLTKSQKAELKEFKQQNPDAAFAQFERVTVLVNRTGRNMGEFTVSIAGFNEKKIRPKVGAYHAMARFNWGTAQPIPLSFMTTPQELADEMAYNIANSF